jgi:hypothetical protein
MVGKFFPPSFSLLGIFYPGLSINLSLLLCFFFFNYAISDVWWLFVWLGTAVENIKTTTLIVS